MQWAHPNTSAAATVYAIGPSQYISSCGRICDGPTPAGRQQTPRKKCAHEAICDGPTPVHQQQTPRKKGPGQNHCQLQLNMQWAHPKSSAAAVTYAMGPSKCTGSRGYIRYWPILEHRQLHLHMRWANPSASAANSRKLNGPNHSHRQLQLRMRWAHPKPSAALLRKISTFL
jgi:hypothetical protein